MLANRNIYQIIMLLSGKMYSHLFQKRWLPQSKKLWKNIKNWSFSQDQGASPSYLASLSPPYWVEFPFQKEFLSLNRPSSSSCFSVWMLLPTREVVGCLPLLSFLPVDEEFWSVHSWSVILRCWIWACDVEANDYEVRSMKALCDQLFQLIHKHEWCIKRWNLTVKLEDRMFSKLST